MTQQHSAGSQAVTLWERSAAAPVTLTVTLPLSHPSPRSALRLPAVSRLPLTACVRSNSNRAAICHLHRQLYGRRYPVLLVSTDGSTVRLRYSEPKRILMVRAQRGWRPRAVSQGLVAWPWPVPGELMHCPGA